MSNLTKGRKKNLIGESGRENSGRSRRAAPHTQLDRAGAEAEPQTLRECLELSCSIPRGAGAVLAPWPDRGRERALKKTANHQGLVSARHRPALAEPDTYLLFTVTSLSTRVITAWFKIYTCGAEFQAGSHVADWKIRTGSPPRLGDAFCCQIYPIRPGFL